MFSRLLSIHHLKLLLQSEVEKNQMTKSEYLKLTVVHKQKIGSFDFKVLRIKDIDTLFSLLLDKTHADISLTDERMPYWADLWPSAIALSEYLTEHSTLVKNQEVIELGCGLGLPGMVASTLGGKVLMTDYLEEAISFARLNWEQNVSSVFNSELVDWRNVDGKKKYDVVLASDVAYENRSFQPLLLSFKALIKKNGKILLSEPNRKFASPFIELLKSEFEIKKTNRPVQLDSINYVISIYECRLL